MCGIAAVVRCDNSLAEKAEVVEKMVSLMRYRGPDASGVYRDPELGTIGHARLSIIDPSGGANQPFSLAKHKLTIVFNGEIFNYLELRQELELNGYSFRTASDTEVLLAAYHFWGDDCVTKFNGMWAFVILDAERHRVFCSRDRFGIKPFLYCIEDGSLFVASEAKAINLARKRVAPNFDALAAVIKKSIGGQNLETCFTGVMRLAPSHNLIVENGTVSCVRYWDYPTADAQICTDFRGATERLSSLLVDAIGLRLRSDVPVGFTLSGGIDSSAVVSLAPRNESSRIAYTAAYTHKSYQSDETAIAKVMTKSLGIRHELVATEWTDVLPVMKRIVYHLESPHAAPPMIPYWKIMERAKQDVTVLLEGQGADELLGGYVDVIAGAGILDSIRQFRFKDGLQLVRNGVCGDFGMSGAAFLGMIAKQMIPGAHKVFRMVRGDEQVYENELRRASPSIYLGQQPKQADGINQCLCSLHRSGLVNLLQYSDALPMAHSIESRLPFMDYRLVEFAFQLPGKFKIQNGVGKAVLREALRGKVSDAILDTKKKRGFDTPIAHWFRDHMSEIVHPVLLSAACRQRGLFNTRRLEAQLAAHRKGEKDIYSNIFKWMITELWFQTFID